MPPSGFNQDAINYLLYFVRDVYQTTLDYHKLCSYQGLSEVAQLEKSIGYLEGLVHNSISTFPGASNGVGALSSFMIENYKDLIKEIHEGKKKEGYALKTEIEHISNYLKDFKL